MSYIGNSPGVASQRVTTTLTATAGQTQFTAQSGYVLGYVDVYLNGAKLVNGSDFEAITGTYITLFSSASAGDVVELVSYVPRGLSDGYTKAEADAKFLDVGGDTATGAINLGPDGLVVNTNQLVTKNGNVGIGTANPTDGALTISNPTNQLSVNQGVPTIYGKLNVGHFTNGAFIGTYAGSNTVSDVLRLGTGGTERIRISSSGDFGVGTASNYSGVKLQAQADRDSLTRITVSNQDPGTSAISSLGIEAFGGGWHLNVPASSTYQNPLIFDFGGTEVARISSAGLIGIGNTSPQEKLHVTNSAGDAAIRITSGVTNGKSYNITSGGGGNYSAGVFAIMDVTAGTTPFSIVSGSVGINTTSPAEKLHVQGNVRVYSGGYPYIDLGIGTTNYWRILHDNPGDRLTIGKNGASAFIIDNQGNSFVNSSNPSAGINLYIRNTTDTGGDNTRYAGIQFQVGSDQGTAAIQAYRTNSASDYSTALAFLTKGAGAPATNPVERIRITSTGSLAFANTNTSGIIRRTNATGSNGITIQANAADTVDDSNAGAKIQIGGGAIGDTYEGNIDLIAYGSIVDSNRNQIRFSNRSGTNTVQERMRIDHNGKILIGLTSSANVSAVTVSRYGIIGSPIFTWTNATSNSGHMHVLSGGGAGIVADGFLAFGTNAGGANTFPERMRITTAGDVGIGTDVPLAKLHTLGSSYSSIGSANNHVRLEGGGGNGIAIGTLDSSSGYATWIQSGYVPSFGTAIYPLFLNPLGASVSVGTQARASTSATKLVVGGGVWHRPTYSSSLSSSGNYIFNLFTHCGNTTFAAGVIRVIGTENQVNQTFAEYDFVLSRYVHDGTGAINYYVRLKQRSRTQLNNGYGNVFLYLSNYASSWTTTDQSANNGTSTVSGSTSIFDIYARNEVGQACSVAISVEFMDI